MANSLRDMKDSLLKLLFELLGEGKLIDRLDDYWYYEHDTFHVDIVEYHGSFLVSIDLHSCFNKTSQCPIHFVFDEYQKFSKRKIKRIHQALNFLLRNKNRAGGFFGRMEGFDDLDYTCLFNFYNTH